jgi:hypothetical protein
VSATDEIKPVRLVSKDGGEYCVRCPHCSDIIGIDGADMSEIRGEQYQHKRREWQGPHGLRSSGCDGWLMVTHSANFVRELPTPEPQ